jgi:hypothetical protein
MYIIINKTKNTTTRHKGSWPHGYLCDLLNAGDKIIVISLYSGTIKIPIGKESYGEMEWEWEEYNIPTTLKVKI